MTDNKSAPAGYVMVPVELLERIDEYAICDGTDATISDDLFTQLVAALAAAPKAEPVGYVKYNSPIKGHTEFFLHEKWCVDGLSEGWVPLYAAPQPVSDAAKDAPKTNYLRGSDMYDAAIDAAMRSKGDE